MLNNFNKCLYNFFWSWKYYLLIIFVILKDLKTNKSHGRSLRISSRQDQFTNFGVTDTFQNFIAKKLDQILEK